MTPDDRSVQVSEIVCQSGPACVMGDKVSYFEAPGYVTHTI